MSDDPRDPGRLLIVGRVGRPHGVRGDVYVDLLTDRTDRVEAGAQLFCRDRWLTVERSRASGTRWLVHFVGIDDRDAAARYTSVELSAPPVEDDHDALWVHELIGSVVVEVDGTVRGRCVSVLDNPAADLLELESGALVPVTFVVTAGDGRIEIDPPDGLFDVAEG